MDALRAHNSLFAALEQLQESPDRLDREREQLSDPPPPYYSGETTQPPSLRRSPEPAAGGESLFQRVLTLRQSTPREHFNYLVYREQDRIIEQLDRRHERRKETLPFKYGVEFYISAQENVKNYWIEQGIWKEKWTTYTVGGRWKHEESPTPCNEPSPEPQPEPTKPQIFGRCRGKRKEIKRTLPVTADQRAAHQRDSAGSRPYHQFVFQVSKEREWLEDELYNRLIDYDREAYNAVKKSWMEQKIWNPMWGDMPGQTWMHEDAEVDVWAQDHPDRGDTLTTQEYQRQHAEINARLLENSGNIWPIGTSSPSKRKSHNRQSAVDWLGTGPQDSLENGVDLRANPGNQNDGDFVEECAVTLEEPLASQAKKSTPSNALPTARLRQKRKRIEQEEPGNAQEPHSDKQHTRPKAPQPKRPRTDQNCRRSLPACPLLTLDESTNITTDRRAEVERRNRHRRCKAMPNAIETRPTIRAQDGRSDKTGHIGLRRSFRIKDRQGTSKSTIYDGVVRMPVLRSGDGAQQKRGMPQKRSRRKGT